MKNDEKNGDSPLFCLGFVTEYLFLGAGSSVGAGEKRFSGGLWERLLARRPPR
jgi:hypothetical protein